MENKQTYFFTQWQKSVNQEQFYQVGKTYNSKNNYGHFSYYDDFVNVNISCRHGGNVFVYEIEVLKSLKDFHDHHHFHAEEIKILREVSKEEIKQYLETNWKEFVKSDDEYIRKNLANHGYGLDTLVYDQDRIVRFMVALNGRPQDLDILVNDNDYDVKSVVVGLGTSKHLDILVKDSDWMIREDVARKGIDKYLKILAKDTDSSVIKAVKEVRKARRALKKIDKVLKK